MLDRVDSWRRLHLALIPLAFRQIKKPQSHCLYDKNQSSLTKLGTPPLRVRPASSFCGVGDLLAGVWIPTQVNVIRLGGH